MPIYRVYVDGYDFDKRDDNIGAARLWARAAFPKQRAVVVRITSKPRCQCELTRPCSCDARIVKEARS